MHSTERVGTIILLIYAIIGGLFPVLGKLGVSALPPLLYIGASVMLGGSLVLIIDLWKRSGQWPRFTKRQVRLLLDPLHKGSFSCILYA